MTSLAEDLAAWDQRSLAALLGLRPDVLTAPAPRTLSELANRLESPYSVSDALVAAPLPCLQLAEALQALGGEATRAALDRLLGVQGEDLTGPTLRWLEERAVLRRAAGDVVVGSRALEACFPTPLGLDRPLAGLLPSQTVPQLQKTLKALGRPVPARKAECLAAVQEALSDPARVRAVVAGAPAGVRAELLRLAASDPGEEDDDLDRYEPERYRRERSALEWAAPRGLAYSLGWSYGFVLPAEVALALRGETYRAPFAPHPPDVPSRPVDPRAVARESAATATATAGHATALADLVLRAPLAVLRSGGVGTRELARVAKRLGTGEVEVRLVLELAGGARVLDVGTDGVRAGPVMTAWREAEPAEQYAALLAAWWVSRRAPTTTREADRTAPALAGPSQRGYPASRAALLTALASRPPDQAVAGTDLSPSVLWEQPLVHDAAEEVPFARTWHEAELLGVVALGALSPLGRALVAGDPGALLDLAREALPATADRAMIGPDLTAVVPGTPSARVTALLDRCADREGRGGAVVWRLSAGSIRRALDEGADATGLRQQLADVAGGSLPQPLTYLLDDVARRHGSLRVRPAVSVVRSDDEGLLAQAAADRSLRTLGLALLAPTVATSTQDVTTTTTALRAAGYLPLAEDAAGVVALAPAAPDLARSDPAAERRQVREVLDQQVRALRGAPETSARAGPTGSPARGGESLEEVAGGLLAAGVGETATPAAPPAAGTEAQLVSLGPRVSPAEVLLLARAVDEQDDVEIDYLSATGRRTHRRLSGLELVGGGLEAWCHLREDERTFVVSRVQAVRPVGRTGRPGARTW